LVRVRVRVGTRVRVQRVRVRVGIRVRVQRVKVGGRIRVRARVSRPPPCPLRIATGW